MHPIINIALRAARRAGRIIVRAMDRIGTLKVEEKAKNDFVSEIDRAAEDAIIDTIMRAYPDHGVVGEERGAANEDAEFVWVIDPLDGTSNYLAGIPHFCVSIGVRRGPVLEHGVIVDPVRNEEFSATRGEGARPERHAPAGVATRAAGQCDHRHRHSLPHGRGSTSTPTPTCTDRCRRPAGRSAAWVPQRWTSRMSPRAAPTRSYRSGCSRGTWRRGP